MVDPTHVGGDEQWMKTEYDDSSWHLVNVPHTWNVMDEFYEYEGEAWYRLDFASDGEIANTQIYLHFEAVYYRAEVWLNGTYLGEHEGGYTPFRFDVSGLLEADSTNTIVIKVDNYRRFHRVPDDIFDWWPYGGIVRDVSLKVTSKAFIDHQYIVALPNITAWDEADFSEVVAKITVANKFSRDFDGYLRANILDELTGESALDGFLEAPVSIPSGENILIELTANIDAPKLWHFDHPHLYVWKTTLVDAEGQIFHEQSEIFGIRLIELKDGQFLLNGEPVRLVGMTRHVDSPEYGLAEPVSFMAADYDAMKRLNMVLSRPVHYPQDESVLDYCDRNGILLVPEIPAWQIEESHLRNELTIAAAKQQLSEMILASYNHPSIWAWSVGNEIGSDTRSGHNYVGELVALTHKLDPSRPVGFASYRLLYNQENDATQLTDFVFMNEYFGSWHGPKEDLTLALDRIHELWPDKVVIISEFGLEAKWTSAPWFRDTSSMNNESYYYIAPGTSPYSDEVYALRTQLINDQMDIFRARPFVAGAIFWTYQDYRSDMNFYMGLLDRDRNPTPVIDILRLQYSPIREVSLSVFETEKEFAVELYTRGPIEEDMPVYTLREYTLSWEILSQESANVLSTGEIVLPEFAPATSWKKNIKFMVPDTDYEIVIKIFRPNGFPAWEQNYTSDGEVVQ
jgi:beta-galactosidase/beta-glucuronidase